MTKDASKTPAAANDRELDLLEMLRNNPTLMGHVEELAMMTRDPDDLLKSGHQAEEKIVGLVRGIGKSSLQKWAEAANDQCERKSEENRSKGQHRHSKKKLHWLSLFGRIEVLEKIWVASGRTIRAFEKQLSIQCRGLSLPAERAICDFGSERAYARAAAQMKEHYGIEPPVSQVIKCCMKTGLKLAGEENLKPASALPEEGSDRLLLEIDGTMVPCILDQAPQGDRRKGKTLGYKEMRLVAARDLKKVDPVFAAGFYDVDQAGAAWSRCALAAGWSTKTLTHAVIDGAQWIRTQHDIHFSQFGRALSDCFHVCEYLAAAFPEPEVYKRNKARLLEDRIELILEDLRQGAEEEAESPEGPACSALRYLENRYDSLFYAHCIAEDLPIGSGMIESGHRYVIQARLKLPGCWWKQRNANAMAKIRAAKANGQWESLWTNKKAA